MTSNLDDCTLGEVVVVIKRRNCLVLVYFESRTRRFSDGIDVWYEKKVTEV
jgi:hypothetical protein